MPPAVFKTDVAEDLGQAGSIPVRLRHRRRLPLKSPSPTADVRGVTLAGRLDDDARDAVLDRLLQQNPDAWITAILPSGMFTPLPDSYDPAGHPLIEGCMSALNLVVSEDRELVVEAWERALGEGVANANVRPVTSPERLVQLHFVDATHRHGVFLGAVTGFGDGTMDRFGDADQGLPPRVSVVRKDSVAVLTEVDDAAVRLLGRPAEDLLGRRALEFVHPDDHAQAIAQWLDMLAHPGRSRRARLRHRRPDGSWLWLEVTNHNRLDRPEFGDVLTEMVDITEQVQAIEAARAGDVLLRRLGEALPVGVLHVDAARRIRHRNSQLVAILGAATATTVDEQFEAVLPGERPGLLAAIERVLRDGDDEDVEVRFRAPGEDRCCTVALRALRDATGEVTGAALCVADVTEDIRLRAELDERATVDDLTRCLNRASTLATLEHALRDAHRDAGTAVVLVDLNEFRRLNDAHGDATGDRLLEHVADQLRAAARKDDVVGRLGGDEFLVICRKVPSPDDAVAAAARLAHGLSRSVTLGAGSVGLSASFGVAWAPTGHRDTAALIRQADEAMHQAKRTTSANPVLAPPVPAPR